MRTCEAAGYVAAIIDGEGTVDDGSRSRKRAVRIANTERDIIDGACEALDLLGIGYTVSMYGRGVGYRDCYEISIARREALELLAATVTLRSRRRAEKLQCAISSYCWVKRPPAAELHRLYVDEKLTLAQIGDRLGVAAPTAHAWLVRAGIPRRSLSEAGLLANAR